MGVWSEELIPILSNISPARNVGHLWQMGNASLPWSRAILPAHLTKEVRLCSSNYSSGSDQGDDE